MIVVPMTPSSFLPPPPPPRPVAIGQRARLRVVQDGAQDCSTCRNMAGCWTAKGKATLSEGDIVSNLLVCRLKRGINRDRTTRVLLGLLRPKLRKTARWVATRTRGRVEEVVRDLESVAIESLLADYVMGELAPPLVWLFHEKHGGVRHWAVRTVGRLHRERELNLSYGTIGDDASSLRQYESGSSTVDLETRLTHLNKVATDGRVHSAPPPPVDLPSDEAEIMSSVHVEAALEVIEDGKTLTAVEYRVLKFCLLNARGSVRMTDWLHQYLAKTMDVPRKDISRIYGVAYRKLIEAVGLRGQYLRARGIEMPKARRVERTKALTADEIIAALHIFEVSKGKATILDVAWALDVTDMTVHNLRRRFAGMTPDEIREAMRKKAGASG